MQNNIEIDTSLIHQVSSTKTLVSSYITYLLSLILLFAGISKIIDPSSLINNLGSVFPFLSDNVIILIPTSLPLVEICLGLSLIFSLYNEKIKERRKLILISIAVLFGIFFLYSIYGFIIGNQNDCGCFGNAIKSSFGWGMMGRNLVLFLLSIFILKRNKGI